MNTVIDALKQIIAATKNKTIVWKSTITSSSPWGCTGSNKFNGSWCTVTDHSVEICTGTGKDSISLTYPILLDQEVLVYRALMELIEPVLPTHVKCLGILCSSTPTKKTKTKKKK